MAISDKVRAAFFAAALLAVAATPAAAAPRFDSLVSAALDGDREALRAAAKLIAARGPQPFKGAAQLRPLLRREALNGSSASATAYAILLQHGIGGEANPGEAPQWYARGAQAGNVKSVKGAAVAYALGWGVRRDTDRALRLLAGLPREERAREMLKIARALLSPGREEPEAARQWLGRAAVLGTSATVAAAGLHAGLAAPGDPEEGKTLRRWLQPLIARGDTDASIVLARHLLAQPDTHDRLEAIDLLLKAAGTGDRRGIEALSKLSGGGQNDVAGDGTILQFLEEKALAGSNPARVSLGEIYAFRAGAEEGAQQKAQRFLTLAARDGDAVAQYRLGMLLLTGARTEGDTELARAYLSLAAAQGNAPAALAAARFGGMSRAEADTVIGRAAVTDAETEGRK
ncbi:TPR repeat protein [Pseudochelatococcus lubricantis]|uniref:TPR repeat protein n=1 Tax=Pseudochelatococcus lubricantis TaxID=1538102 RepID=A0ABX0V458_9HYPH|nr:SEL1-like repeat protein [Pseudochelatococcus lubricantis]NIJ57861.1 TPR repeat protein [Pseudochelatococcus lubricantis]